MTTIIPPQPLAAPAPDQGYALTQLAALRDFVTTAVPITELAPTIRDKAAMMLLDTLGCILAGRQATLVRQTEAAYAAHDQGPFHFPGGPALALQPAAAIAAMASAWDEACEGLPYAHGRPGLALVGALLPLAVIRHAAVSELLDAIRFGYEVGARAGGWLRIRPGMHVDGNWPAIGVAAGVARLLGEPASRIWQAINIAACQLPTSLYAPIRTGDMARNTYLSHCAHLGLLAAFSASGGITAPDDVLVQYATAHASPVSTPVPPPDHPFLLDAYFKPYACVRHAHYGLEAAMRLRDSMEGEVAGVRSIALEVYEEAATYAGNRAPTAALTGQFSLSLAVAAGLRFGEMGPEFYQPERFEDPQLRALEHLVKISTRSDWGHGQRAAILTVVHRGKTLVERVDSVAGGPERPLSRAFLVDKFIRYSSPSCGLDRAEAFAIRLLDGPHSQDFADLWTGLETA